MARWLTIGIALATAVLFGWGIPLVRLFNAFQPMIVALSIMVAAVFVRLNRGMPSLEWKSINPDSRADLTTKIVDLTKEYIWIVGLNAALLAGLLALNVVGKVDVQCTWPAWTQ